MRVGENHGAAEANRDRRFRRPTALGERHHDRDHDEHPLNHAADHDERRRRRHAAAQMVQAVNPETDGEQLLPPNGDTSRRRRMAAKADLSSRITVLSALTPFYYYAK